MDNPPVNAATVPVVRAGHHRARARRRPRGARRDPAGRGRGFNAGVDIKEMQATEGTATLAGANRGCLTRFAAVYECAVAVIAAVHGYCLGGGIGLVGNADIIVAPTTPTSAPRGRPGRARRRHPSRPPGAPAQDAPDGVHGDHRHRRPGADLRVGARVVPVTSWLRGPRGRRGDRREDPDRDPGRQGVLNGIAPSTWRSYRLRAGLHVRADPLRGRRRSP